MKLRTIFIWIVIIICAVGLGFFTFNFFIMPRIVGSGKNIVVPNLVGKPLVETQKIILTQNFTLGDARDVFDTIFPYGYVVGQKPLAGTIVKTGRKINVLVSKGRQIIKVPFLEQMTLDQGLRILTSLAISTSIESLKSTTIPAGKIIGLDPGSGTDLPIGRNLKVFVSSGLSGIFLMPSLVGLPTSDAINSVVNNGLILGSIQTMPSEESEGLVIIQYPEDGMRVRTNDTVRLFVSVRKR